MSLSGGSYRLSPSITNGFGLASLIVGIISFCTPLVGGLAAIVLGFLGFQRSKQTHTGKGMSIAGMALGCVSIVVWATFWSGIMTLLHFSSAAVNSVAPDPSRLAVEHLLRDIAGNNLSGTRAESDIPGDGVALLHEQVKDLGVVQKVDNTSSSDVNDVEFLQGVVTFDNGQRHYIAHVSRAGGTYRVTSLAISP